MARSRKRFKKMKSSKAWRLLFFNAALLLVLKLVVPGSYFHLAQLAHQIIPFSPSDIVRETNEARAAFNLPPLKEHYALDIAAAEKLNDMVNDGYFAHVAPDGTTPWHWIKKNQYGYISAGENLALGFIDPEDAVNGWLDSASHRDNLLDPDYKDIGVAVGRANLEGIDGILVVQVFGEPSRVAAAVSPGSEQTVSNQQPVAIDRGIVREGPVTEPVRVARSATTTQSAAANEVVDLAYISYLSLILGALAFMVFKKGLDNMTAATVVGHVALLLIAFLTPALNILGNGIVF